MKKAIQAQVMIENRTLSCIILFKSHNAAETC